MTRDEALTLAIQTLRHKDPTYEDWFIAGAEWARKQTVEDIIQMVTKVRDRNMAEANTAAFLGFKEVESYRVSDVETCEEIISQLREAANKNEKS